MLNGFQKVSMCLNRMSSGVKGFTAFKQIYKGVSERH